MALPPGFLDEIRARVSLAQLAGRKLAWDRKSNPARGDYWAPCPFHQEKSASFHVDETKGVYYCFGCQAKGDAISFLRETEGLGFLEAVEQLAGLAGMTMPARDPAAAARATAELGLVEAMEAAVQFYRMQLNGSRAADARAYLDRRGMSAATRDRFGIGFAPDARTVLLDHLVAKGFAREKLVEAGLVGLPQDGGSAYDRFRGRIMFPIRDARGRAIAFGARALSDSQQPKYLNSPETPLFDKGRSLYNIDHARPAAAKAGTLLLVEGYMDAIALDQAGIEPVVAPLGTAITEAQLELAWRLAPEPVVALDGDAAGLRAAQRLVDLALPLLGPGRSLRFALLPGGQDPDELVRSGGPAAMRAVLDASLPPLELLWRRETEGALLDSPERRAALDARLRAHLARIADAGLRAHYEADIRTRRAALFAPPASPRPERAPRRKGSAPARGRPVADAGPAAATRASALAQAAPMVEARIRESAILFGCLNHPEIALQVEDRLERCSFQCADLLQIRDALLSALASLLNAGSNSGSLADRVAERLGRNVMADLLAPGQVRSNPYLRAGADAEKAALAIGEELARHAALTDLRIEARDAEQELVRAAQGEAPDWIDQRLRQAAEAAHGAFALAGELDDVGQEQSDFASNLASIEAQQAAHRSRKR